MIDEELVELISPMLESLTRLAKRTMTPMDFCVLLRGIASRVEEGAREDGIWDEEYAARLEQEAGRLWPPQRPS